MKQRTPRKAQKVVDAAVDQVVEEGGTVHEVGVWDAMEMALDGEPKESIADRIRRNRAMPYQPKGEWRVR
jgi:hypothetical protein